MGLATRSRPSSLAGRRAASGHRIGEWHQRAKLPDIAVRAMRMMHVSGPDVFGQKVGYRRLGYMFGCGMSTARDIILYRTRADA